MSYQTIDSGENGRPDLEQLVGELNPPIGYIGTKIFPKSDIAVKSGRVFYQTLVADSPAQTNRALGEAPQSVVLGESSASITTTETIKRYAMDWTTVPLKGGVEKADKIGAIAAARSVQNALETSQIASLITALGTDITSAIIDGLIAAADSVRRYAGKLVFVCNVTHYRWLIQQNEIKNLLIRTFKPDVGMDAILSIRPDVFRAALQGIFLFDDVLIGDEERWPAGFPNTMAVAKVSAGEEDSYMYQAEYGRTFVYIPEGKTTPYRIDTASDSVSKSNLYDAVVWSTTVELNSGAKSLVKYTP